MADWKGRRDAAGGVRSRARAARPFARVGGWTTSAGAQHPDGSGIPPHDPGDLNNRSETSELDRHHEKPKASQVSRAAAILTLTLLVLCCLFAPLARLILTASPDANPYGEWVDSSSTKHPAKITNNADKIFFHRLCVAHARLASLADRPWTLFDLLDLPAAPPTSAATPATLATSKESGDNTGAHTKDGKGKEQELDNAIFRVVIDALARLVQTDQLLAKDKARYQAAAAAAACLSDPTARAIYVDTFVPLLLAARQKGAREGSWEEYDAVLQRLCGEADQQGRTEEE